MAVAIACAALKAASAFAARFLRDLVVKHLRAAPGGVGDLGHYRRPIPDSLSRLGVKILGDRDALLRQSLHVYQARLHS